MEVLELESREPKKTVNHSLRTKGSIPGVIYGGEKNYNVSAKYADFIKLFKKVGEHQLFKTKLNGKEYLSLIKDFQLDPVKDTFIHFDLLEVTPEKRIKTRVPLEFVGTPKGVMVGGILEELNTSVYIEVQVKDLPSSIKVDISELNIGDSIHFRSINLPKGSKLIDSPDTVAVLVAGAKEETQQTTEQTTTAAEPAKKETKKEEPKKEEPKQQKK